MIRGGGWLYCCDLVASKIGLLACFLQKLLTAEIQLIHFQVTALFVDEFYFRKQ